MINRVQEYTWDMFCVAKLFSLFYATLSGRKGANSHGV